MDPQEFREAVLIGGRNIGDESALDEAVSICVEVLGDLNRQRVRDAVQIAGRLAGTKKEPAADTNDDVFSRGLGQLGREELEALIKPSAENLRAELFRKREPPFADYSDAVRWIRSELENPRTWIPESEFEQRHALVESAASALKDACEIGGGDIFMEGDLSGVALRFVDPEKPEQSNYPYYVQRESPLYKLARYTRVVGRKIDQDERRLVGYVLSGIPLDHQPFTVHGPSITTAVMPDGSKVPRRTFTVRIDAAAPLTDALFGDLRTRLRAIVKALSTDENFQLLPYPKKKEDIALAALLKRMGGVPEGASLDYWRDVHKRWIDLGFEPSSKAENRRSSDPDAGARNLRERYYRLKKKPSHSAIDLGTALGRLGGGAPSKGESRKNRDLAGRLHAQEGRRANLLV